MTTLVGTQTRFEDALYQLCELDYDAAEAYEAAINRIENSAYKSRLTNFKLDHQRHIKEISELLRQTGHKAASGPSAKRLLTQGKVVIAELLGDTQILRAMSSNEVDTHAAYEKVSQHAEIWPEAIDILQRGLADEITHQTWLRETIGQ